MGNYFLMSFRFNKQLCSDFGLVQTDNPDIFCRISDYSFWKFRQLYDYGWGKENGYYKIPIPSFNELVEIVLQSKNDEDKYGAAAIIIDDFGDALLNKCFDIMDNEKSLKKHEEFFEVLKLQRPINRSSIIGKSYSQILDDYNKWKVVSEKVSLFIKSK